MIYTDSTLQPIYQGQSYVSPDGTQYPIGFPLNEVPSLTLVTEVPQPIDSTLIVLGFTIVNNIQVWNTRQKTNAESIEDSNNNILAQIKALEATQTPRRLRDAMIDSTWLKNLETEIATLRTQLK